MKQYLVLMLGGIIYSDEMGEKEKHNYLGAWGRYLSQLDATGKLVTGFPLTRAGKLMSRQGIESNDDVNINAYMILKASDYEEVEKNLVSCPFLEQNNASFIIKEVKPNP